MLPFDERQIVEAVEIMTSTIQDHQFEPNLGMTCMSGKSVRMFAAIMYNRQVAGEDERAIGW